MAHCIIYYYLHVLARIRRNSYLKPKPRAKTLLQTNFCKVHLTVSAVIYKISQTFNIDIYLDTQVKQMYWIHLVKPIFSRITNGQLK